MKQTNTQTNKQWNKQTKNKQASKETNIANCFSICKTENYGDDLGRVDENLTGTHETGSLSKRITRNPLYLFKTGRKVCANLRKVCIANSPPIFISPRKTSPLKTTGRKGHKPLRKVCKKLFSQLQNRKPSRRLRTSGRRLDGDPRNSQNGSLETPYILSNPLYFNFARFRFSQLLSF